MEIDVLSHEPRQSPVRGVTALAKCRIFQKIAKLDIFDLNKLQLPCYLNGSVHCTHRDILANFFFPERGDQSASFSPPTPSPPSLPPSPKDKSPKKVGQFLGKKVLRVIA